MNSFLLDGPLMALSESRKAKIERMAQDLVDQGEGLLTDGDAMRVLHHLGYASVDVAILAGEARMVAFQSIVAKEMMDNST